MWGLRTTDLPSPREVRKQQGVAMCATQGDVEKGAKKKFLTEEETNT